MADLIVLRGQRNAGKTTTCGFIYQDLLPFVQQHHSFNHRDVTTDSLRLTVNGTIIDFEAILILPNGKIVSIISAGDDYQLKAKLEDHITRGAHTIICCTRSVNRDGSTFRMIQDDFEPNHPIVLERWVIRSADRDFKEAKVGVVNAVVGYVRRLV